MTTAIETAVAAVQAKAAALSGIRQAPSQPTDSAGAYPFAITWAAAGSFEQQSLTSRTGLHTIATEIHVARKDLARDLALALPYVQTFPDAILDDPTLGAAVDTVLSVTYIGQPSNWGGVDTWCYHFETRVKIRGT